MNLKEQQIQKWALDGILITSVTQDEADAAPWTRFINRGTTQSCHVPWSYVLIQESMPEAVNLFKVLFGFHPQEEHCSMCGKHFAVDSFVSPQVVNASYTLCIKKADIKGILDSRFEAFLDLEISDVKMTHDTLECTVTIPPLEPNIKLEDLMTLMTKLYPTPLKPSGLDFYNSPYFKSPLDQQTGYPTPPAMPPGWWDWKGAWDFKGASGIADWKSEAWPVKFKKK